MQVGGGIDHACGSEAFFDGIGQLSSTRGSTGSMHVAVTEALRSVLEDSAESVDVQMARIKMELLQEAMCYRLQATDLATAQAQALSDGLSGIDAEMQEAAHEWRWLGIKCRRA